MIKGIENKRAGIYYLNDIGGIFDTSYKYTLEKLSKFLDKIIVVHSGELTPESESALSPYTNKVLFLEKGYKVDAYALGVSALEGKDNYDEVLCFDNSLIGPFYDLKVFFEKMNDRDLDFWGLHFNYSHPANMRQQLEYHVKLQSEIITHLPWSFIAFRKSMFSSDVFTRFLSSIKPQKTSELSFYKYEIESYELFSKKGFISDSFLDTADLSEHSYNPLLLSPYTCIHEKKSPFLYAKLFHDDMTKTLEYSLGQDTVKTFEYIDTNTDYDINLVWDHILRVGNQHDIKNALSLTYDLDFNIFSKH